MSVAVSACTQTPFQPASHDPVACRDATGDWSGAVDSTELVLAGVSRARANDVRCGDPNDHVRICRALFLLATLDPALHLDHPPRRQEVGDALSWALQDAESVATPPLVDALRILHSATRTLTTSTNERHLSDALAMRARPDVTDAIDDHWRSSCS
ncbi:MAG: hypothetical protein ACN4GZ_05880 [Acidimicrobiales bacterium]